MTKKKTLFMETTEIAPEKTAAEVAAVLVQAGASQIATDYQNGEVVGLRWTFKINGNEVLFAMPARVDPLYRYFSERKGFTRLWNGTPEDKAKGPYNPDLWAKAKRVGWRQLLRWVQAQMALVETGMVKAQEVFLPYAYDPVKEQTLFQKFEGNNFKMIEAPKQPG